MRLSWRFLLSSYVGALYRPPQHNPQKKISFVKITLVSPTMYISCCKHLLLQVSRTLNISCFTHVLREPGIRVLVIPCECLDAVKEPTASTQLRGNRILRSGAQLSFFVCFQVRSLMEIRSSELSQTRFSKPDSRLCSILYLCKNIRRNQTPSAAVLLIKLICILSCLSPHIQHVYHVERAAKEPASLPGAGAYRVRQ